MKYEIVIDNEGGRYWFNMNRKNGKGRWSFTQSAQTQFDASEIDAAKALAKACARREQRSLIRVREYTGKWEG